MRDPFRWSISLGRWGVPTVRLHVFFLFFAIATCFLCWQDASSAPDGLMGTASAAMAVLLLSVLAHEWSHWLVARHWAIAPDTLVIGPLGGVSEWQCTTGTPGVLATMLAGPAANFLISAVCLLLLRATSQQQVALVQLLNPLQPVWVESTAPLAQQVLQLTLWINWLLLLVNLLPAFPFDGGRILRSALHVAQPDWREKRLSELVFWIAVGLSAALLVAALVLLKHEVDTIFPSSFALFLLAVVLLVSARRDAGQLSSLVEEVECDAELEEPWPVDSLSDELGDREYAGADLDADLGEEEDSESQFWGLPVEELEQGPAEGEIEADEERRVDAILRRLHDRGLNSLTPDERALLERVSARYRSRLGRRS